MVELHTLGIIYKIMHVLCKICFFGNSGRNYPLRGGKMTVFEGIV